MKESDTDKSRMGSRTQEIRDRIDEMSLTCTNTSYGATGESMGKGKGMWLYLPRAPQPLAIHSVSPIQPFASPILPKRDPHPISRTHNDLRS